jgi:hypothetical protein
MNFPATLTPGPGAGLYRNSYRMSGQRGNRGGAKNTGMYHLKPAFELPASIQLPNSMYRMGPIQSGHVTQNGVAGSPYVIECGTHPHTR